MVRQPPSKKRPVDIPALLCNNLPSVAEDAPSSLRIERKAAADAEREPANDPPSHAATAAAEPALGARCPRRGLVAPFPPVHENALNELPFLDAS